MPKFTKSILLLPKSFRRLPNSVCQKMVLINSFLEKKPCEYVAKIDPEDQLHQFSMSNSYTSSFMLIFLAHNIELIA